MKAVTFEDGTALDPDERKVYEADLLESKRMRVEVGILDRNEKPVGSLTAPESMLLTGGVAVNDDAEISRQLQLEVLDVKHRLAYDPESASETAIYLDNYVKTRREDFAPTLNAWCGVDVFTGRLETLDREGAKVKLVANGKEIDYLDPAVFWRPLTVRRGVEKTEAIKKILGVRGETKFILPNVKSRIPKTLSFGPMEEPWHEARKVAMSMGGRSLDYDGSGYAKVYDRSAEPKIIIREGLHIDGRARVTPYSRSRIRNVVQVIGGDPRGKRHGTVIATAAADKDSPLSPQNLGKTGFPLFLVERIENDEIRTLSEGRDYAEKRLRYYLAHEAAVAYAGKVLPHMEVGDVARLDRLSGITITFVWSEFTIPLVPGLQDVGTIRRRGMGGIHSAGHIRKPSKRERREIRSERRDKREARQERRRAKR